MAASAVPAVSRSPPILCCRSTARSVWRGWCSWPAAVRLAKLGVPTAVSAVISGFGATDTLDLVGFAATRLTFANDVLTVSRANGGAAHLHFSSAYTGHHFAFSSDGHGGTNIHVI